MTQSKSDGKSAEAKLVESPAKRQRDELNVYSPPESNRKRRVAEETSDSSSIQPIPSPSSPKVDEDDLPELGVHLDDFGEFEVQDSDEDEKLSFTTESSKSDKAQIYKLQGCRDPEFLKHVEKFSEICLQRLIEEGHVTNRLSENCNKLNIDKFFKKNPHCVVYYNPDKPKVGSSTQYQVRLDHLREKNTPGVDEIATVIVGDSLTQTLCDFIEKTRKDLFEAMGVSSELPESLAELMKKPYFFLNVLYHFSEHRNHEYFLMKQETALLESFMQIKFGLETKRESMHEWAAADTPAFENNYNLCWRRSCHIRQVIFDTSGLHMEQLIVMACVLSWKPGDRIGQPIHFLFSTLVIAQTMRPEYMNTFPDAIPASDKIDDCYNVEFLKPHRSQAQEKCKEVARKIRDAAEPTFTLVDTNKMAFSIDTETNEDVDPEGRHLNFYLSLGFLVVYEDEDAILLYTPNSKSFVYFVGPLCKLLGHYSFKTKANRASSTRRACSALSATL